MEEVMDPILGYLLEFNEQNTIEYNGRYLIPAGGLAEMLKDFKKFQLNREEVVKPDISAPPEPDMAEETLEDLMSLI